MVKMQKNEHSYFWRITCLKAREVQKYQVTDQVSYADAVKNMKESELARSSDRHVVNSARESENRQLIEAPSPSPRQRQTETNPCIMRIH